MPRKNANAIPPELRTWTRGLNRDEQIVLVRDLDEKTDTGFIRACLIELQEFERRFDPRMPRGADIVDEYVANMLEQCRLYAGKVLVAELDGAVVGYATILTRVPNEELEDGDYEYGLISDLVVLESCRGRGFGRKLLAEAEAYARTAEVQWLRIGVLSDNRPALELYGSLGFSGRYTELEKNLRE